ncbi:MULTISPECIES: helix-turn-helix domain-containing protein [Streptomyces]|uniref:helix-turn-helix domain-containing protein n=1 Tax=Streptomyces lycopersici TaxID=2974589 RepID=UPI0021D39627|nr:helix-turn-helix transcriptional regulator [Streptomyces sp. NEAU-383]
MNTAQHHPGEPDQPARGPAPTDGEDLAALLTRLLEQTGRTQKDLAEKASVPYPTLNAWLNRTRGMSRVSPDTLRDISAAINILGADKGVKVTPRQLFEAAGRPVPGPTDEEREQRLLRAYRSLSVEGQRALIQTAEAMMRTPRISSA